MRECADLGITHVWMHRGPGAGGMSSAATGYGRCRGITVIDGGGPPMLGQPHRRYRAQDHAAPVPKPGPQTGLKASKGPGHRRALAAAHREITAGSGRARQVAPTGSRGLLIWTLPQFAVTGAPLPWAAACARSMGEHEVNLAGENARMKRAGARLSAVVVCPVSLTTAATWWFGRRCGGADVRGDVPGG